MHSIHPGETVKIPSKSTAQKSATTSNPTAKTIAAKTQPSQGGGSNNSGNVNTTIAPPPATIAVSRLQPNTQSDATATQVPLIPSPSSTSYTWSGNPFNFNNTRIPEKPIARLHTQVQLIPQYTPKKATSNETSQFIDKVAQMTNAGGLTAFSINKLTSMPSNQQQAAFARYLGYPYKDVGRALNQTGVFSSKAQNGWGSWIGIKYS